jgi:hypothetical protein
MIEPIQLLLIKYFKKSLKKLILDTYLTCHTQFENYALLDLMKRQ